MSSRLGQKLIAEAQLVRNELRIERAIKRALAVHKRHALSALDKQTLTAAAPPDAFSVDSWDQTVNTEVNGEIHAVLLGLAATTLSALNVDATTRATVMAQLDIVTENSIFSGEVRRFGRQVAEQVNEALTTGMAYGETTGQLKSRLETVFARAGRKAATIARDQTHGAAEKTKYTAASLTGEVEKEWLTMHDRIVRPSHQDADGQTVLVNEPFQVGDSELMYPRDDSGSIEEIANCRCQARFQRAGLQSEP